MSSGTVNNALYRTRITIGASRFKQVLWYLVNILLFKNPLNIFLSLKVFLLKAFGAEVGNGVVIKPSVNIKYPWKLKIGEHSWIGEGVWIDNLAEVVIGNNVCISQGALLLCGNHNYKKETFDLMLGNIVLEEGVWIGAKAIVCAGVICATHSVLSVGSVVTKNTVAFGIYQGNPAQKIGERIITT
jgi:putative colanic acid biosynthesis acetyltransferase WcaF